MDYRSFHHESRLTSSSASSTTTTTLQEQTPSDTTCQELSDTASVNGLKRVRFTAVDLVISDSRNGIDPPPSRPLRTKSSISHSAASPLPPSTTSRTNRASSFHGKGDSTQFHPKPASRDTNHDGDVANSPRVSTKPRSHLDDSLGLRLPPCEFDKNPPRATFHSSGPLKPTDSLKETSFCSIEQPDASICADINATVQKYLSLDNFDFASYAQDRVYVVRKVLLVSANLGYPECSIPPLYGQSDECVTLTERSLSAFFFAPSKPHQLSPQPMAQPGLFATSYVGDKTSFVNHGCGYSMFAQQHISTHQLILVERPCAIFPFLIALDGPHKKLYLEAFRRLSPNARNAVREFNGRPPLSEEELDEHLNDSCDYEDIVVRHSYLIELVVPEESNPRGELSAHRGFFIQASKIQHGCRPNAVWRWDPTSFSIIIRAVRPIAPDEEITISFVPPELPYNERQTTLEFVKGFRCLCRSCRPHDAEGGKAVDVDQGLAVEGDSAREYLLRFQSSISHFKQWLRDQSIPEYALTAVHEKALHLIAQEGLQILDTQPHTVSPHLATFQADLSHDGMSSPPHETPGLPFQVVPCHQRDVGFHVDILAMCYGAIGNVHKFRLYLEEAIKDRDERSAWRLTTSILQASENMKDDSEDKVTDIEREQAREGVASKMRLVFVRWAANPATFPLWARRKTGPMTPSASVGGGLGDGFVEVCESLDDYALCCLGV